MLKWAVNQPRNSYLAKELVLGKGLETGSETGPKPEVVSSSYSEFHALRGKLKRKSLGLTQGKENQLTSTPLPSSLTLGTRTPLLKDLSNILATPPPPSGASGVPTAAAAPLKFACTLPTFEAEYSPNAAVIPGSLIALRGVGIPDSYFEKPRYLEQKPLPHPVVPAPAQTTLSSSQMGDVTLERMIDAILESNRKGHLRQPRQHLRQRHRQQVLRSSHSQSAIQTHSPTYRPAFDPASDLCEYWKSPSRRDSLPADGFEEREVCSPASNLNPHPNPSQSLGKRHSLQLRRQRVVRRKRKITTKISSSVRQSAQKLLAAARSGSGVPSHRSSQKRRHISPDSGHNSTSDFEEELVAMGSFGGRAEAGTKRRLSFSFAEDLFVDK
ncbi:uncharacterized protein [Drosophila takahashii]|uniref:uncharacterized protein n=1 Tax=Drosophila takahashii TaxID=29030 RepID=UPI001CF8C605|nr:uncharacterized protein LOC108068611 [Drosophila takahashii]